MVARPQPELDVIRGRFLRRDRLGAGGLALLAIALMVLIARDVFFPPAASVGQLRTYTVQRGSVTAAVTGTGTVVPSAQQNVGFREAGTLSEVDVKVGDQVKAGQVLARLDSTTFQQALAQAQAQLASAQAALNGADNSTALAQAQHQLASAQQNYNDASTAYNNARTQFILDGCGGSPTPFPAPTPQPSTLPASGPGSKTCVDDQTNVTARYSAFEQASSALTGARDGVNAASVSRPTGIASAQAAVAGAQTQVQAAQTNLNQATLTAPIDGVVTSLNGAVGESVGVGGGTTAQAPGSGAPLPSVSSSSSAASSGAGGSAFAVLSNTSGLQVVAPLAEGDASRVQPGQSANVTFDAVSGLTLTGHVLAVAPAASVISNVTNYYVTLVLDGLDPRLRSGMTANATVVVQQAANALVVPNSAITRIGGVSFVTLLQGRSEQRVRVQTGVIGDNTTEVTSGLNEGDKLVLPQLRVPSSSSGGGGRGFGGGGAVRVG